MKRWARWGRRRPCSCCNSWLRGLRGIGSPRTPARRSNGGRRHRQGGPILAPKRADGPTPFGAAGALASTPAGLPAGERDLQLVGVASPSRSSTPAGLPAGEAVRWLGSSSLAGRAPNSHRTPSPAARGGRGRGRETAGLFLAGELVHLPASRQGSGDLATFANIEKMRRQTGEAWLIDWTRFPA